MVSGMDSGMDSGMGSSMVSGMDSGMDSLQSMVAVIAPKHPGHEDEEASEVGSNARMKSTTELKVAMNLLASCCGSATSGGHALRLISLG